MKNKIYTYNVPFASGPMFGKVLARNLRAARKLLRKITGLRALPARSDVWA